MSQPKRYDYTRWQLAQGSSMSSVHPDRGDEDERRCVWVAEDDYIRLKKDYDAATKATFDAIQTITQLRDDYAALAAENERLRKAGDTVVAAYCMGDWNTDKWKEYPVVAQWLAAKEGTPSERHSHHPGKHVEECASQH